MSTGLFSGAFATAMLSAACFSVGFMALVYWLARKHRL